MCNFVVGYSLPWEDVSLRYPANFAKPVDIAIQASNGASDYGNKFGEPVIAGFSRSFGLMLQNGERREWIKPIMFSGGIGNLESSHVTKEVPEKGRNMYIMYMTVFYASNVEVDINVILLSAVIIPWAGLCWLSLFSSSK